MRKQSSLLIPNDKQFLTNKKISDRLYVWILLNGEYIEGDIYIDKKPRNAYKKLNIDYKSFYRRLEELIDEGYLIETNYKYKVSKDITEYERYIYEDTARRLLETNINNIIKIYIYLGSLYSTYGKKAWFTYSNILSEIGYSENRDTRNNKKIKMILEKLKELGLIEYRCINSEQGEYVKKFQILKVNKKCTDMEGGDNND